MLKNFFINFLAFLIMFEYDCESIFQEDDFLCSSSLIYRLMDTVALH